MPVAVGWVNWKWKCWKKELLVTIRGAAPPGRCECDFASAVLLFPLAANHVRLVGRTEKKSLFLRLHCLERAMECTRVGNSGTTRACASFCSACCRVQKWEWVYQETAGPETTTHSSTRHNQSPQYPSFDI
jgi:hypothetical protein